MQVYEVVEQPSAAGGCGMFLLAGAAGLAAFALIMGSSGECGRAQEPHKPHHRAPLAAKARAPRATAFVDEQAAMNASAAAEVSAATLRRAARKPSALVEGEQQLEH